MWPVTWTSCFRWERSKLNQTPGEPFGPARSMSEIGMLRQPLESVQYNPAGLSHQAALVNVRIANTRIVHAGMFCVL